MRCRLGDRLVLRVDFVDALLEFWDQIRVLHFEAWNPDRSEHLFIVRNGRVLGLDTSLHVSSLRL